MIAPGNRHTKKISRNISLLVFHLKLLSFYGEILAREGKHFRKATRRSWNARLKLQEREV